MKDADRKKIRRLKARRNVALRERNHDEVREIGRRLAMVRRHARLPQELRATMQRVSRERARIAQSKSEIDGAQAMLADAEAQAGGGGGELLAGPIGGSLLAEAEELEGILAADEDGEEEENEHDREV